MNLEDILEKCKKKGRNMKFTNEKFRSDLFHIYVEGKANHTRVKLRIIGDCEIKYLRLNIKEAQDMKKYLDIALQDALKREQLPEDEDEDE
jgi:hypothetical protein